MVDRSIVCQFAKEENGQCEGLCRKRVNLGWEIAQGEMKEREDRDENDATGNDVALQGKGRIVQEHNVG